MENRILYFHWIKSLKKMNIIIKIKKEIEIEIEIDINEINKVK